MIDHISFSVNNFQESLTFYDETFKILGIERLMTFDTDEHQVAGYGKNNKPTFWIGVESNPNVQEFVGKSRGFHVAFQANTTEMIHQWYKKCLELGGQDNGAPGPRLEYHPGYLLRLL